MTPDIAGSEKRVKEESLVAVRRLFIAN